MAMLAYGVKKIADVSSLKGGWGGHGWSCADELRIDRFHPESSGHRPVAKARLLYDDGCLHVVFKVEDRYVRCVRTRYQDITSKDSCVELFIRPKPGKGYFAFEMNCGGTLLFHYITNPERAPGGFKEFVRIPWEDGKAVAIAHSAPSIVDPERQEPLTWTLELSVPFALLEKYVGPLGALEGQTWDGNLFKCADESSHPHWASWNPIGDELNFHVPRHFGKLRFLGKGDA